VPSADGTSGIERNLSSPNTARIYDYLLGGHDSFPADRELAGRLLEICPSLRGAARDNRAFLGRAVTWAARQGISQFADLGNGMPARPSAGDAARAVIPGARTACIDNDPLVISRARALLAASDRTAEAVADLAAPAAVLAHPGVRAVIDPAEPACIIPGLVLSLMPARQAREVVAGYADLVAPGSYVAISCGRCDDEALWKQLREAYTAAGIYDHASGDVEGFLSGLELVPPGLVAAQNWRGGWHDVRAAPPGPAYTLAGWQGSDHRRAMLEYMIDKRPDADRLLVAELYGEARHRARWRELSQAEESAAVAGLRELAGGRADLLAEVAGVREGTSEGEMDEPLTRQAAMLARKAGADPEAIPAWIEEGRRRAANARQPPFSGGLHDGAARP
jgi:hypothetical protein